MWQRSFIAAFWGHALLTVAHADEQPAFPFEDGLWSGGIISLSHEIGGYECWAKTTHSDGTTLMLAKNNKNGWSLRLSNPNWDLPLHRRNELTVRVDFYTALRVAADVANKTDLEIANLGQIGLLALIENGHSVKMNADGFHKVYDLEGSAKIIEKFRKCRAG